jgi:transcriptional regulator GlxA family with amidase domain
MHRNRTRDGAFMVAGVAFPGVAALDLIGPFEAFELASRELAADGAKGGYRTCLIAREPGGVRTLSGVTLQADYDLETAPETIDLLITPGYGSGAGIEGEAELLDWLRARAPKCGRVASICSGALLLAKAGLLSGKRVTTHWMDNDELRSIAPDAIVEAERIFCKDGKFYSSGGLTAGIDLALAIIEEDFGRAISLRVAKRLVVFLRRQGDQAQFSSMLSAQMRAGRFGSLIDRIEASLGADWTVEAMAESCAMSERNFARQFQKTVGCTPRLYVERRRLERARAILEASATHIDTVARDAGYSGARQFGRAFQREFGVSPSDYRRRFGLADGQT